MNVYKAINAVQAELAKEGISKDRRNTQQQYSFRGIDDVYNALSPLLAKHGLCILPRVTSREVVERTTKSGTALFYVTVGMDFDFVCADDGSKHVVSTYGEAMDSGDKATNKAMSAAYKYACMQAFSIPTEGDNDADATTHTVAPKISPIKEALGEELDEEQARYVQDVATNIVLMLAKEPVDERAIYKLVSGLNSEQKLHLWRLWAGDSKIRTRVTAISKLYRQIEAQAAPEQVAA